MIPGVQGVRALVYSSVTPCVPVRLQDHTLVQQWSRSHLVRAFGCAVCLADPLVMGTVDMGMTIDIFVQQTGKEKGVL
jgi:hypothetical protein